MTENVIDEWAQRGRQGVARCLDWLTRAVEPPPPPPNFAFDKRYPSRDLDGILRLLYSDEDGVGPGSGEPPRHVTRNTVTVAVEWDPEITNHDEVARRLFHRVISGEAKEGRFMWRAVRSHAWRTDSTWIPRVEPEEEPEPEAAAE